MHSIKPLALALAAAFVLGGCSTPDDSAGSNASPPPPTAAPPASPDQMGNRAAAAAEAANPGAFTFGPGAYGNSSPANAQQGAATAAIQSQLQAFFSLAQVGMPMTGMTAISQGQNLAQFFAPQCSVTPWPDYPAVPTSDALAGEIGNWLAGMQIGKFELKKSYVRISPDRSRGRAIVLVSATLTYMNRLVTYENWYATDWAPTQGNWLITTVTPLNTTGNVKYGPTAPEIDFGPYWGPGWGYY